MSRKSDVVAGMGVAMSIIQGLVKEVEKHGGTDEDIHRLATSEGEELLGKMADLIVRQRVRQRAAYLVTVDYSQSLAEMIKAGEYDWVNSEITAEHFPVQGKGKQEMEAVLFPFGKGKRMTSEEALAEMAKEGYRPAKIEELLALGAACPELQKQFLIVALGSVWQNPRGTRRVPCLRWPSSGRYLRLHYFGHDWDEYCRFVAVRK